MPRGSFLRIRSISPTGLFSMPAQTGISDLSLSFAQMTTPAHLRESAHLTMALLGAMAAPSGHFVDLSSLFPASNLPRC